MLANAIRRPPSLPSPPLRDAGRSAAILAVAGAVVTLATLALSGLLVPRSGGPAAIVPTPESVLDLAAQPTQVGGQLVISGDRAGSVTIASASSDPGYEPDSRVAGGLAFVRGDVVVSGDGAEIVFSPSSGEVSRIEYDGLSFYLDPGDCTATPGGRNGAAGLLHLRLECRGIEDVRDGSVIGIEGVIAVPADVLGDRGDLPPSGGSVEVGDAALELVMGVGLVGGVAPTEDDGVVPLLVPADDLNGLGVEYDPEDGSYALTAVQLDGGLSQLAEPCALPSEPLGQLNPQTSVVRLSVQCPGVALPDGRTETLSGTLVVDLVALDPDG